MGGLGYIRGMYVKTKKNASGSKSVLVVSKTKSRSNRLVKTIGCGRTAEEISKLIAKGHEYIEEAKGPLLPGLDAEESEIESFIGGLVNSSIQVIGPELIFGTLYDRIGYGAIDNEMFRHLVVCRLFNPGSKLKTVEYLERYLHVTYSVDSIYRFLDNLCVPRGKASSVPQVDIQSKVEAVSYAYTKSVVGGEIAVCFYDMTTLYFADMASRRTARTPARRFSSDFLSPQAAIPSAMRSSRGTRRKAGRCFP